MAVCRPVTVAKEVSLSGKIKRFSENERQLLKKTLQSHGWQSLSKDFRIHTYTDVRREHLAGLVGDLDDACLELKEDVNARLELVKRMCCNGEVHVYKGGSHEGSKRLFYRYYLFIRANTTGTYDVFLASLCRKEEELGLFGLLWNAIGFVLFPQHMLYQIVQDQLVSQILARCIVVADDEDMSATSKALLAWSLSRGVVPKGLEDKIIEFEFVEDLIDKGFLVPNGDGSQMTLKFG
ncbi:uncharacterized protein LOC118406605 isoform X2 [Branchiostoma floridae]|uniref:Uncharacterized protein LOC118406605 isoform X2 n=1 Tax=Branchiostoma floridae TaxID=7739 RepID=A0A9J7KA36_BRAFL|nr:uncharacterized protein LOC118406605 isoform X2 [Branchiostoma floridae]